jgi:hypothetical protein
MVRQAAGIFPRGASERSDEHHAETRMQAADRSQQPRAV